VRTILIAVLAVATAAVSPVAVPFTTIDKGQQSNFDDAKQAVVRTAAEWTRLWNQHAGEGREGDKPAVDFTKSTVVGVFMGSRPTGGYNIEITSIEKEGNDLVVTYREQNPPSGAMLSQALSMPFHVVKIDRHTGPIRFKKS